MILGLVILFGIIGGAEYCRAQNDTGTGGGWDPETECITENPYMPC